MDINLKNEIETLLKDHKVVLFMKGNPTFPQCGFSAKAIAILKANGVSKENIFAYDILSNNEMRQGIKEFSNWPTIPQLYVNAEFVGGSDIMLEMHDSGELKKLLES